MIQEESDRLAERVDHIAGLPSPIALLHHEQIMPLPLEHVLPWGRSFDEYRRMFALSDRDLDRRIVGCADGPAAFNAAMSRAGLKVISADPLYAFDAGEIRSRIEAAYDRMVENARLNHTAFVWDDFGSPEGLGAARLSAMEEFLADYPAGRAAGRYLAAALPALPFADRAFDLALCSHYLFTYSEQVSAGQHLAAALEMCRIAGEVRIFPLVTMFEARRSPHLDTVAAACGQAGCQVEVRRVPYEFQRGGNEMLVISRCGDRR